MYSIKENVKNGNLIEYFWSRKQKKEVGQVDNVDKTIEAICDYIQEELKKSETAFEISETAKLTKALADLITARANLEMSACLYKSGGSKAKPSNKTVEKRESDGLKPRIKAAGRNMNKMDKKAELIKKMQKEMDRRTKIENEAIQLMQEGKFEQATDLLSSMDDSIIKEINEELGKLDITTH